MEYIKYASPYIEYRDIEDIYELMNDYIDKNIKDIDLSYFVAIYQGCTIPPGVLDQNECPVDEVSMEWSSEPHRSHQRSQSSLQA